MRTDDGPSVADGPAGTGADGGGDADAVYDPAEDSMLAAGAAVDRTSGDDTVIDVGTGSGVVAARIAAETGARVVGVDVNPHACRVARTRSRPGVPAGDGSPLPVVRGNLVAPIRDDVADLVVFNPPYLPERNGVEATGEAAMGSPTGDDDRSEGRTGEGTPGPSEAWLRTAYAGGASGRSVIAPFLDAVGRVLAPGGRVLLLVSTLTGIDAVFGLAREAGFAAERVAEEPIPFERLVVLELERS